MNKYIIIGIGAFALMTTTVYALTNDNNDDAINNGATIRENCPYHNEECPYYEEKNDNNCPNNKSCQHHRNNHERRNGCHHYNK